MTVWTVSCTSNKSMGKFLKTAGLRISDALFPYRTLLKVGTERFARPAALLASGAQVTGTVGGGTAAWTGGMGLRNGISRRFRMGKYAEMLL